MVVFTAQVPEGANLYPSKRKNNTAQVSEVKACILYTAQVPEAANFDHSKRKSYTAQVSEVKTCILVYYLRLKLQKELTYTVQKGKVIQLKFQK